MTRRRRAMRLCGRLALFACMASSTAAWPQTAADYPAKPLRMIVPFPPGPALDLVARLVAQKMSVVFAQQVIVDNRSGANGAIGSELVARAAPDGYTILAATASTHVTSVFLTRNLPYDPVRDFTPITAAVEAVTCLAAHPSLPANSVKELIAYAKRNPGKLSYGSSGVGSVFQMLGELFKQTAGVDIVHVPYKGVAPAVADLIGGQIPLTFTAVSNALPYASTGKLKLLAILEPQRYARLPNVPSISEALPKFRKPSSWFGFFGPAGLPTSLQSRLHDEMVKALNATDVRAKLDESGLAVIGNTPAQFAALIQSGLKEYGAIIKAAGIQPE